MKNYQNYKRQYFMAPEECLDWTKKEYIEKAPIWCSVDLRDGNQSLIVPMGLKEKIEFFKYLVKIGFKEIEVGFPAASETEFTFLRTLIEQDLIPDDVTVQVLTQAREHIIRKTFDSLAGCKNAVVHFYNSTSLSQREQVFKKSKEEIAEIAEFGARLVKQLASEYDGNFRFEYSPESFTGTEVEFSLEVCNRVLEILEPSEDNKVIINIPVTVQHSLPHVYASQVEYMCKNLYKREHVVVSLHPHNDRGCAVADSELGILAGADRIEGTLFGNGERTGNVDIVTMAMNMFSQGVDPELDFSDMPKTVEVYEKTTGMNVHNRQPYAGQLVFAAFSGSHQDAIAKGMKWREEKNCEHWTVPYLPIDPKDVGREYESDVIRINSQSGKGGIGYLLEQNYSLVMPAKMIESVGYSVKSVSDHAHKELKLAEVYEVFNSQYVNVRNPLTIKEAHFTQGSSITAVVTMIKDDKEFDIIGKGNGRLNAINNAIKNYLNMEFSVETYTEHALTTTSSSKAIAYVGIKLADGTYSWGAGVHNDIMDASARALVSAINRAMNS
ncbi:MAG: 2-isopropylmalate synthase [Clostridia bacterium]